MYVVFVGMVITQISHANHAFTIAMPATVAPPAQPAMLQLTSDN